METLGPPKHPTPPGYYHRPPPTHFTLDAWWAPAGLYQEESRCTPAWTRKCLSCFAYPTLTPVTSCPTSPRASTTSTPAMSFMGTSREYVAVLDLRLPPY